MAPKYRCRIPQVVPLVNQSSRHLTYVNEVTRLDGAQRNQPGSMVDTMASAKLLESKIVAKGLHVTFTLLYVIVVVSDKLGRWVEKKRYPQSVQEYCKIQCSLE